MKNFFKLILFTLCLGVTATSLAQYDDVQEIYASDGLNGEEFGTDIATNGSRLIVGAPKNDNANGTEAGAIYIYDWLGTTWGNEQKIIASDGAANDWFGNSVDISGNRVIVGAPKNDENGTDSGATYIYEWNGSSWDESKFPVSDFANYDYFGWDVAIDGNYAVVGAELDGSQNDGSAYFYEWNGSAWIETQKVPNPIINQSVANFGYSVDISGTRAVISVPFDSTAGPLYAGAVYVYDWNGSSWTQTEKITASNAEEAAYFGWSVALDGDQLIVGAYGQDYNLSNGAGTAYIYKWNGSSWDETQLIASDSTGSDYFGDTVAIDGDRAIVGAYGNDDAGSASGSAYIFDWNGSSWEETKVSPSDASIYNEFGTAVAVSGDKTLIAALQGDGVATNTGSVYYFSYGGLPDPFCSASDFSGFSNPIPDLIYWDWDGNNPYTSNSAGTAVAVLIAPAETVLTTTEITAVDGSAEPGMVYFDEQTGELYIADAGGNLQDPLNVTSNAVASPNEAGAEEGEVYFNTTSGEITVCETAGSLTTPDDPSISCITQ